MEGAGSSAGKVREAKVQLQGRPNKKKNKNVLKYETLINNLIDKAKVKLSDGTMGSIFSRGPLYDSGLWPVNCHLCNFSNMPHYSALQAHINKKKHQRLLRREPIDAAKFNAGIQQKSSKKKSHLNNCIIIYPGERITKITSKLMERLMPVADKIFTPQPPPEVFHRLSKSEQLQKYNEKAPVIGLSYCFYVDNFTMIGYYCSLCKAHVPESDGYRHFVGRSHRNIYVLKHFPKLLKRILDIFSAINLDETKKRNIADEVIRKIYRNIEEIKGLQRVQIVQLKTYACQCLKYTSKIVHYDDNHVLITDEKLKEMVEKCQRGEQLLPPDPWGSDELNNSTHIRKPERRPDSSIDWDGYRRAVGAMLDELDRKYEQYEKMPEKHTAYQTEWKKFWNRRIIEIESSGLDPNKFDLHKEWIPEWKKIQEKIYKSTIVYKKFQIRKSFGLQFDKRSPSPIRKAQAQFEPSPSPIEKLSRKRPPSSLPPPPVISASRRRTRSPSPVNRARQIQQPPVFSATRRRTRSRSPVNRARQIESPPAISEPSESPGVLAVLRLLIAIDEYLGSLAPKALEYLSKSILYEKDNGPNANQLLFNEEYYVFFVTAKEKLKGQLMTNLIKPRKHTAVTTVVKALETLIEMFDDFCKRTGRTVIAQPKNDRPKTPSQQESLFTEDDQFGGRSQDNYNIDRREDVDIIGDRSHDDYNRDRRPDVDIIGARSEDDYNRSRRQDVDIIGNRSQDDYSGNRRQDVDIIGARSQDDYNRNRCQYVDIIGDQSQDHFNRNRLEDVDIIGNRSQDDFIGNRGQDVDIIRGRSQDDFIGNRRQGVDIRGDRSQDDYNRDRRQGVVIRGDRLQDDYRRNRSQDVDIIGDRSQDDYIGNRRQDVDIIRDRSQDDYNRSRRQDVDVIRARSQEDNNRNRRQDVDRHRDVNNQYDQYQRRSGEMDSYRSSGGYINQSNQSQNQYDIASSNQSNFHVPNSKEYGQSSRSMISYSNQAPASNQYSRGGQSEGWESRTNITFGNKASNTQGSADTIFGDNYRNNKNRGPQGDQNFRRDRDENLSIFSDDRGGNYNSNNGSRSAGNYKSNVGNSDGNYSAYSRGDGGNFNSGYEGFNPGRKTAPLGGLVNKPLDSRGYSRSYMNTRGFDGGNY